MRAGIAELPLSGWIVFFGKQSHIIAQRKQSAKHFARIYNIPGRPDPQGRAFGELAADLLVEMLTEMLEREPAERANPDRDASNPRRPSIPRGRFQPTDHVPYDSRLMHRT
jgi:hypothetical protein